MSEQKQWEVGDVVQLKSGGPQMTVERIWEEDVECVWFDDKRVIQRATFIKALVAKPTSMIG